MPATTRSPRPHAANEPDTTQTLAYWMGRVDANIDEQKTVITDLKAGIDGCFRKNDVRWNEFEEWRRQVDVRLQKGNNTFDDHQRRLNVLESSKAAGNGNGKSKFGSWEWFRDGYLERFILVVLTVVVYKVLEIIVANWAISNTIK
jgi:hypothetical protein